jgi:hypothetical protein
MKWNTLSFTQQDLQGIIHFFLPNYGQTACLKEVNISGPNNGKFQNWIFLMALQRSEYVNMQKIFVLWFCYGSTVLDGLTQLTVEVSRSHLVTLHWAGLLWTSDRPVAETSTWKHNALTRTGIHAPSGIRTCNPSRRAAAEPRGHRDRHWFVITVKQGSDNPRLHRHVTQ